MKASAIHYADYLYASEVDNCPDVEVESFDVDTVFNELMDADPDDDWVAVHPDPECWDKLAFRVVRPHQFEENFKNFPTPTLTIEARETYYVFLLSDYILRNFTPKKGKRDPRNTFEMAQQAMSRAYGLEPVDMVPNPDGLAITSHGIMSMVDSDGVMQISHLRRTAGKLLEWLDSHGYPKKDQWLKKFQVAGGLADSDGQRVQRGTRWAPAGTRARHLKGNYKAMVAEAVEATTPLETVAERHDVIARVLDCKSSSVRSLLTRASELTDEQRDAAYAYAKSKGLDLSHIDEHNSAYSATMDTPELELLCNDAGASPMIEPPIPVEPMAHETHGKEKVVVGDVRKRAICAIVHKMKRDYPIPVIVQRLQDISPGIAADTVKTILKDYQPYDVNAVIHYAEQDSAYTEYVDLFRGRAYAG